MNIGTLEAGAEFSYGFKVTGEKLGKFTLIVGLNSNKTEMVTGEKEVCCFCIGALHGPAWAVPRSQLTWVSVGPEAAWGKLSDMVVPWRTIL